MVIIVVESPESRMLHSRVKELIMLWIKALHVLAVIAWLAGIFYLPRIFVHYVEGRSHGEDVRRLVVMARRLFGFMTMMAVIALLLGLWLWLGFHDSGLWRLQEMVAAEIRQLDGADRLAGRFGPDPRA